MMMKTQQLVSIGHLARRIGVPVAWLRTEAEAGRLPAARAGDGYLFDLDLVERILLDRAQRMPQVGAVASADEASSSTSPVTDRGDHKRRGEA